MDHNAIHDFIDLVLPYIISALEIMGILIVVYSALKAFWEFIQNSFFKQHFNIQYQFAIGLATGLEFKVAAEILKTVIVRDLSELVILGAVILLRAILSVLIHFEMKNNKDDSN